MDQQLLEIKTLGGLRAAGYKVVPVKDEMRRNLVVKLKAGDNLFPNIIGYDRTVIPEIVNAILSKHDLILLGLRGQAKTRILRAMTGFLDEFIPIIKDSPVNDNPFSPVSRVAKELIDEQGDDAAIEWISREERYGEKLATPDVTIADLIGDIDPIKAAAHKLTYADEKVMHFGIIPRMNRGIFVINELPDLQPRIQVGLFNILQEKDLQIRGFPVRIPLDIVIMFSANPEDYTNRGNIITPLKDRIDSQIITHYPRTIEDGISITDQESLKDRDGTRVEIPYYFKEIIENIAFEARHSEYIDQKSGVSARVSISCLENLVSNVERRGIITNDPNACVRVCDLNAAIPAITGKVELVYEGEQEGVVSVAKALIGKAVRSVFKNYFPDPLAKKNLIEYQAILGWFAQGNRLELGDDMPFDEYFKNLSKVTGLKKLTNKYLKKITTSDQALATAMEFVLEGLSQNSSLSKDEFEAHISYKDMVGSIFGSIDWEKE